MKNLFIGVLLMGLAGTVGTASGETPPTIEDAIRAEGAGDHPEAIRIYTAFAEEGDVRSMISLGIKYHTGDGVARDYARAMDWYLQAYDRRDGDAFNNIGVMYRDGLGVKQNKQVAFLLFLATHMEGLGTQATQYRAGSNGGRISQDIGDEAMREAMCWTWAYVDQIVRSRGSNTVVATDVLPAEGMPRIKDNDWWLDSETEALEYTCAPPWN